MRAIKMLEMLNDGRIEEVKEILRDEIYTELLSIKPGAKRRYAAMKKYFTSPLFSGVATVFWIKSTKPV